MNRRFAAAVPVERAQEAGGQVLRQAAADCCRDVFQHGEAAKTGIQTGVNLSGGAEGAVLPAPCFQRPEIQPVTDFR